MALTVGSNVFNATLEQVCEMAELAGLRFELCPHFWGEVDYESTYPMRSTRNYFMWQDRQTGGGGCRLVWTYTMNEPEWGNPEIEPYTKGVVWVSRHAGYPQADMTEMVAELFAEMGCTYALPKVRNPHIYGNV